MKKYQLRIFLIGIITALVISNLPFAVASSGTLSLSSSWDNNQNEYLVTATVTNTGSQTTTYKTWDSSSNGWTYSGMSNVAAGSSVDIKFYRSADQTITFKLYDGSTLLDTKQITLPTAPTTSISGTLSLSSSWDNNQNEYLVTATVTNTGSQTTTYKTWDSSSNGWTYSGMSNVAAGSSVDIKFYRSADQTITFKLYDGSTLLDTKQITLLTTLTSDPTVTTSPMESGDEQLDSDGDGWSNEKERLVGTNPYSVDSDNDGINDPQDSNPTVPEKKIPGFEAVLAIFGLIIMYLIRSQ